ncbi:MAG: BrxA/BrxB family bacilliredoxin [Candidatus Sumerlaeia bacterium]
MLQPYYDPEAVRPMEEELERVGVQPLRTAAGVDEALARPGVTLVIINSICGCAAGNARPGAMLALQHRVIPDHLFTVFAGMDHEAVARVRAHMSHLPPSSPCIALFREGRPVFVLERRHIEQMTAQHIADALRRAFDELCSAPGPSIPREQFEQIVPVSICGSSIPPFSTPGEDPM